MQDLERDLPRTQRALARYILANYQGVAFANVKELAALSGVSEATIVRFAQALGFSGYPSLQKEIRRLVRVDLKGTERFELTRGAATTDARPLDRVIGKELENLSQLSELFDGDAFARAVATIGQAAEVVVVGSRSAAPLAHHLWFGLTKIGLRATRVLSIGTETYDLVNSLGRSAAVVLIEFPRHLQETVKLLAFLKKAGIPTVCLTDSPFSPLQGDVSLHAPVESASFFGFYCAPLCLINALLHELGLGDEPRTLAALKRFESLAEREGYFIRD